MQSLYTSQNHGWLITEIVPSHAMGKNTPVRIYLPSSYTNMGLNIEHYNVVYLLHGAPGCYRDWIDLGNAANICEDLVAAGVIPPTILVMPEGQTNLITDTEWADGQIGLPQAETWLARELVPFIDAHYPSIPDRAHRIIGGLSSGGYGAVNTAIHHFDLFANAFGLSAVYHASHNLQGQEIFANAWEARRNSPLDTIGMVIDPSQLFLYLAVGLQDWQDNAFAETWQMEQILIARGVPHCVEYTDGQHDWLFWRAKLKSALVTIFSHIPEQC